VEPGAISSDRGDDVAIWNGWSPRSVKRPLNLLIILGLIAAVGVSGGACGGDDDDDTAGADGSGQPAASSPGDPFRNLATALAAQGMEVDELPKESLNGAESGVAITGAKQGSARMFATPAKAQDYADEVATGADKTTVVGTLVFQAASQDDADFYADAYE
jgi:hypothetical protein